jgi:siroheme synthase-like protein
MRRASGRCSRRPAREPQLAERVSAAARARGVPVWCSDDPTRSDFAMPAIAELGNVRLAISTAGGSPTLAGKLRAIFEKQLGERFAEFGRALARRRGGHTVDERRSDLDGFDLEVTASYPDWFNQT